MPCTGSLSRREGVCKARPRRCAACAWLLPAPRSSGRGQGLHHPLREVPEQGQKLTLGHRGNLQSENTDAYGAKWRVRLSTLDSAPGGLPSSPASRGGATPDQDTNSLLVQRGREADMSLSRSAGAPSAGTQQGLRDFWGGEEESLTASRRALQVSFAETGTPA